MKRRVQEESGIASGLRGLSVTGEEGVQQNETDCQPAEERLPAGSKEFYLYCAYSIGLVCTAGIMSGLTMGLMTIDEVSSARSGLFWGRCLVAVCSQFILSIHAII